MLTTRKRRGFPPFISVYWGGPSIVTSMAGVVERITTGATFLKADDFAEDISVNVGLTTAERAWAGANSMITNKKM